jgi:hypothetical protein
MFRWGTRPIDRFGEIVARRFLAGSTIDTLESSFQKRHASPSAGPRYPFLLAHRVGCGIMSAIDFDFSFRRIIIPRVSG